MNFGKLIKKQAPKKVLIAVPTSGDIKAATVTSLINMMFVTKQAVMLDIKTSSLIHRNRNHFARRALKEGFDYVLMIDADMRFPHDTLDRLLAHDKDVVGAFCTTRQRPVKPVVGKFVWNDDPKEVMRVDTILDLPERGLVQVDTIGMACTLLSRRALKKAGERPFNFVFNSEGKEFGEDQAFCMRAASEGVRVYVDMDLSIIHYGDYPYSEQEYRAEQEEGTLTRKK